MQKTRRDFLKECTASAAMLPAVRGSSYLSDGTILIDPTPRFAVSPWLYMQFMEPLGVTDSSVDAGWDWDGDRWREDLVEVTRSLAPDVVRWGGSFIKHYRWREGVGPVDERPVTRNYVWGGMYTNRVGTAEFTNFCREVGAEPLVCVNFLSGGHPNYYGAGGHNRLADADEAADWVSYANDPDNRERRGHGFEQPFGIKLWQIGNETSYNSRGFSLEQAVEHTTRFASRMKERDHEIKLIGWGGRDRRTDSWWAEEMLTGSAGEYLDMIAMHMMGQRPKRKNTVLRDMEYQKDPPRAWEELMELADETESRISQFVSLVDSTKSDAGVAVTEGHLSLRPHNACPILQEWLTGVFHARALNSYQRHGNRVKICTVADFCGSRWTVNAVMIEVPRGISYLMPAGSVMQLFSRYHGSWGLSVKSAPPELDLSASRSREADKVFVHVANKCYDKSVVSTLAVDGLKLVGGRVLEIAPEDKRQYVSGEQPDVFKPVEHKLADSQPLRWTFPPASVTVLELNTVKPSDHVNVG